MPDLHSPAAPAAASSEVPPTTAPPYNRLHVVLLHVPWYAFEGQARLAADAGVARSTISRLLNGRSNPSVRVVRAVQAALEERLGRPLPLAELFSPDGAYPTPSGCTLCGCEGCFPDEAYDRHGNLRPAFRHLRPGEWSVARADASPEAVP
jgi:DNA-binding XRE family transcriptional regulator